MIDFPPPLPPPLVAQNNKVDQAVKEQGQFDLENSSASSHLRWLEVKLQPRSQESTDKIYSIKSPKNKLNGTLYPTNTEALNWLEVSCSQCSNNYPDTNRIEFKDGRLPFVTSLSGTSLPSSGSGLNWTIVPKQLKSQEEIKDDSEWIDPFSLAISSQSPPKYPRWTLVNANQSAQTKQLAWSLVESTDVLVVDSPDSDKPTRLIPALESVNRSIAFSTSSVGPDIGFLVPPGFRWTPNVTFDSSIRGWSRRMKGEKFLAWNNGDAVGQFYLQQFQGKKWSLGANLGIRSIYQGEKFAGGSSRIGEGVSAGFRFDYALSDTAGIAIGAEQLVHFDGFTDTGRDIYLVASKGWWLGGEAGQFPLATATAGIGTGYLGRNPYLQFGCSNFTDAGIGQAGNDTFYPLCWGPIASGALVINPKLSLFSEFNNFAFVTGASVAPFEELPLRATWGVTLAQDFGGGTEDFRFEPDKTRWFFRISLGL